MTGQVPNMSLTRSATEILDSGHTTLGEGLALFDSLPAASCEQLLGAWAGSGLDSGHYMDGLLEIYGWHGKQFDSAEHVHPLVFRRGAGKVRLGPRRLFAGLALARWPAIARSKIMGVLFSLGMPLMRTAQSRARLRATEYRGKVTATMVYDNLPINDVFAAVDNDTLLGVMDLKGMRRPFFFVLRREASGPGATQPEE